MTLTLPYTQPIIRPPTPDPWHITRTDDPSMSLCYQSVDGQELPDAEVPDDMTCSECLRIQALGKELMEEQEKEP